MSNTEIFRMISTEILSDDWGILTKYRFELRRRSGDWQAQTREAYDRGNGATCLLHNPNSGCVILTRQFRLPVFLNGGFTSLIEAPAGILDGADPEERMRSELLEETGFEIQTLTHLFNVYMSPGSVTEYLAFFTGTYEAGDQATDGGGSFNEGEDIEVIEVPLRTALTMIETGEICDAKTIILLQHLLIREIRSNEIARHSS